MKWALFFFLPLCTSLLWTNFILYLAIFSEIEHEQFPFKIVSLIYTRVNVWGNLTDDQPGRQGIVKSKEHSRWLGYMESGFQEDVLVCHEVYNCRGAEYRRQNIARQNLVGYQPAEWRTEIRTTGLQIAFPVRCSIVQARGSRGCSLFDLKYNDMDVTTIIRYNKDKDTWQRLLKSRPRVELIGKESLAYLSWRGQSPGEPREQQARYHQ